jgi:hypothetical protein
MILQRNNFIAQNVVFVARVVEKISSIAINVDAVYQLLLKHSISVLKMQFSKSVPSANKINSTQLSSPSTCNVDIHYIKIASKNYLSININAHYVSRVFVICGSTIDSLMMK